MLYEGNQLGIGNPRAVVQTVYLNNCLHFGMRSRIEHENLRWGDVALKCLSNGDEYLEYRERTTKTRTGLSNECRDFIPKMFADKGNPRCPVAVYKVYSSKRPEVMNTAESPFYLGVKRGVNSYDETWYVNQAMGKNTIGSIVKDMCVAVGIQGRKSNHSARKTGITSLVHAGVAPTLVQQLSGHKNITSINNYSSASIQQQKDMSSILTKYTSSSSTATITPYELAPRNSQEMVEQILNDISSYETSEIQNSSNNTSSNAAVAEPDACNSGLLGLANNVASSFLSGATMHVAGNIVFQFGMPDKIQQPVKRKRINVIDSDSD